MAEQPNETAEIQIFPTVSHIFFVKFTWNFEQIYTVSTMWAKNSGRNKNFDRVWVKTGLLGEPQNGVYQ